MLSNAVMRHPSGHTVLPTLAELFLALDERGVRYCHWKSNQHLGASLAGETDLDLLVDRQDVQALASVLAATSFKRFHSVAARAYPGIESYLGLDSGTGTLLHLHVHYQLTLGETDLKGYRLPWERQLLARRIRDEPTGIHVADPDMELLLLVLRAALKARHRDYLRQWLGRTCWSGAAAREFRWLVERACPDRLEECARALIGEPAARLLVAMLADGVPDLRRLAAFRRAITPSLHLFRTYGPLAATTRRWVREAGRIWSNRMTRRGQNRTPSKRVLPQGGALIAIIGVDGSGKSTLVEAITAWLSPITDTIPIYLGSGTGPVSLSRRALQRVARMVRAAGGRTRGTAVQSAMSEPRGHSGSALTTSGELLWLLSLARERNRRTRRIARARNLGMIVICDRFPQSRFPGFNDGPAFSHWLDHRFWPLRAAARRERAAIHGAEAQSPDLVIRLSVDAEIAAQRRPEMSVEQLRERIAILEFIPFGKESSAARIDASMPQAQVLLAVKRVIWQWL